MINSAERSCRLNLFTNKETNIFEGQGQLEISDSP